MKSKKLMAIFCCTAMITSLAAGCSNLSGKNQTETMAQTTSEENKKEAEASTTEAKEQVFQIDLATAYAADAPAGVALNQFVKEVSEKSNGTININLFTDGTLGSASDNYASISSGDLDMTMAGLEGLDLYAPEYTFLDAPFLIEDEDHLKALLDSGIGDNLKKRYEDNGFVTLGWHFRDTRELASNKEIKSPADLSGLKLRLPGMTVYVDTWSALNVSSTTVAMSELYTALQTKVAEACEGGYEQMNTLKLYEVQKYLEETDHVFEFVGLYINKKLYDSMSDNQKKILDECAKENLTYADQLAKDNRDKYKQACLDGGMTAVSINREEFREALKDFYYDQFTDKWNVATYDDVMSFAN